MTPHTYLSSVIVALALTTGSASAEEKVLGEGQVTQQALIDALAPPVPTPAPLAATAASEASAAESGASAPRTRGFRPMVRTAAVVGGSAAVAAPPPGRASILVTFVSASSELTTAARSALDILAAAMKSERLASIRFTIEGHADPRGSEELNLKLSQARAESVRQYLIAAQGLKPERINAVGKGSSAPMNPGDPAAPENRRVTIVAQQP